MIKIQNLKKTYKDCVALDTVSMHIRKGEFVAIIGASGSGKTTMLNIIGGLDTDYMGNEYFASADTLFTIPECLSLMPIWKVLSLLGIMNIIKTLFYTSTTTLIFLCTRKKKNFKTVCIASFIITYCISQFGLLFPCVNPLAIVSSFSLICGGYEITWLYGVIELTLYTLLLYLFIRKRIRKVDF